MLLAICCLSLPGDMRELAVAPIGRLSPNQFMIADTWGHRPERQLKRRATVEQLLPHVVLNK
jgi:hypothetical protein